MINYKKIYNSLTETIFENNSKIQKSFHIKQTDLIEKLINIIFCDNEIQQLMTQMKSDDATNSEENLLQTLIYTVRSSKAHSNVYNKIKELLLEHLKFVDDILDKKY